MLDFRYNLECITVIQFLHVVRQFGVVVVAQDVKPSEPNNALSNI